jgi:hypothetical protein
MPLLAAAWLCETACKPLGLEPPLHRRRCGFFTKARGFSSAKARRLLGYAPAVDLDDGLRATAAQYVAAGYLPPSLASATASGFRARIRVSLVRGRRSYGTLAPLASLPLC